MKPKIVLTLIILLIVLVTVVYAADVKWSALAENTTVADNDVLCVIDTGTGNSQKITVLNFFDTIDTFAELNTIVADKTLVNEEDAVTWDAIITFGTNIAFSDAATIDQSANNYIDFTENGDVFQFYFGGTDLDLIWSDGVFNIRNAEDGVDAIVEIEGKDAGEKGILRILSDGDDNYIELHHDDTDGHIITDTGDIHIEAAGGDINLADDNLTTTGTIDLNPAHTGSVNIIDIIPSAAISTNEAVWNSIYIEGTALDPSGDDILLCGVNVNMSGIVFGGTGGDIDGIGINMAGGEDHAIHVSQGKFVVENTVAATAGAEFTIFDIQVHTAAMHANSSIHAIDVATPETPAGTVVAVGTHSNVEVIQQSIGTFSTPNQTEYAGEKHTGGTVWADGVDGSEIFVVDDDEIYVGSVAQFSEIDVIMTTPGSRTVTPTFHYNTAADTWTEFFPADDTDGFQQSGIIRWTLGDISGSWTNNGDPGGADSSAGYWIKIIRTANADPGTPTPTTVKTGAITLYSWSKTGAIDVLSMEADTITEGGNAVPNATDHLGFFGGTTSAQLLAEISDETGTGKAVFATAPVFITSIQLTGADADPAAAAGTISYDNTIAVLSGGALRWYDNDSVRVIVDLETDPVDGDDDKVVAYDSAADGWYMKADADTGGVTKLNDIGDADGAGTVVSGANEHLWTWENDAANEVFMNFSSIDADTANNQWILELSTYDDGDANLFFFRCRDDVDTTPNTVFEIAADGATSMDGGLTVGGSITEGGVAVPNIDETDWVAAAEMADADHGDVAWSGGDATVEACTIADSTYASCYVGIFQAATGADQPFYTDGALTYDATSGTLVATEFSGGGGSLTGVDAATGDSATAFFDAGTIEHEWGGLQANVAAYTGLIAITGADTTAEIDSKAELEGQIADVADFAEADGDTYSNNHDFGTADLEIPQASPGVPNADGEIEFDFTDGSLVIQHGSAHAELGASTDVVVGKLIRCWGGTIFEPDGVNDVLTVKAINSIEFPHGVVITAIYLGVSSDTNYTLTVQNFDDFDTINGGNPTIDAVAYSTDATGEVIDSSPTYATIAAGQIIMISIPATDVDWIHFEIYYYEPAA